jgi:hypothetical protein
VTGGALSTFEVFVPFGHSDETLDALTAFGDEEHPTNAGGTRRRTALKLPKLDARLARPSTRR